MSTIAFIGLGIMGLPMAINLQTAGHSVIGYNRSSEKTLPLVEAGGTAADSITEAVTGADIVSIMVPDSPDVMDVVAGQHGVLTHAQPGTLIIDFSTIRPDIAAKLAQEASDHGCHFLDAPVSGGEVGAEQARLSIMVGGSAEDFAAGRTVLDVVGETVAHVGPSGAGQTVKAANQLIVAGNIALLSEAIVLLEAHAVDTSAALQVLGGGLAASAVLNQKGQDMLARSFEPGFRIDLHHKDLSIVSATAREAGITTPVSALVSQLMLAARASGDGSLDHSALFRIIAGLSARE